MEFFIFYDCGIFFVMGKVTVKDIGIEELLSMIDHIPAYKSLYSWDSLKTSELIKDIAISKDKYPLGTIIFNQGDLVDGLSRVITLSLVFKALGYQYPEIIKSWTPEELRRIKENWRVIKKSIEGYNRESFKKSLFNNAYITVISAEDLSDCFSFFDSGHERGRELDMADILKAYHLVSMRGDCEEDKISTVAKWESFEKDELLHLFMIQSMLWHYLRGVGACPLTKEHAFLFEGVEKDRDYPYVKRVLDTLYCLESPMINGKWFFDHTFHYLDLLRCVIKMTEKQIPSVLKKVDLTNPSQERCFDLYLALALFAADRFGERTQILLEKIFKYSFAPLLEDLSVTLSKLNEHVLDNKTSLLNVIRYSSDVEEVDSYNLSLMLDGMKNISFRKKGPVRDIDFEKDFDMWLKEEC